MMRSLRASPIATTRTPEASEAWDASRPGLTLFEIVLATAVFAAGLAVLAPQLELARKAGLRTTLEADAINRARSVIGLAVAMTTATDLPVDESFDAGGGWSETLTVLPFSPTTIKLVAEVEHRDDRGNRDAFVQLERVVFSPLLLEELTAETSL